MAKEENRIGVERFGKRLGEQLSVLQNDGRDLLIDIRSKLGTLASKIGKDDGEKEIAE